MKNSTINAKATIPFKRIGLMLAVLVLMLTSVPKTDAQCYVYNYYGYLAYFSRVQFNGIDNSSSYVYYGCYQDFSYIVSNKCTPGSTYNLVMNLSGQMGSNYSGLSIWIDWNNNGSWYDSGDLIYNSGSTPINGYNTTYTYRLTIPANAPVGNHRMRLLHAYWYYYWNYGYYNNPCTQYWYYLEYEDYTINVSPPPNDAAITDVVSPTDYFRFEDQQDVVTTLQNVSKWQLLSCDILWWIDGVQQPTYYWTGALDSGATATVTLGTGITFNPVAPWNPFNIRVQVANPRGVDAMANGIPDGNPANDTKSKDVPCILNDAGFVNADAMIPITPGVNNVLTTVMNYAPKPLSTVRMLWKVNGITQSPYDWVGTINYQSTENINVGPYGFGGANIPIPIWASTSIPNGINDEFPENDSGTVEVYKALPSGTYTIGANNSDFRTFLDVADFVNYWGIAGPVTFLFRPGSYEVGKELKPRGGRSFPITFGSVTGSNYDVNLWYSATSDADNFLFKFDGADNITFKDLTLNAMGSYYGTIFYFLNGNDNITIQNCVFNGISNPPSDWDATIIKSSDNIASNWLIQNNVFNSGSTPILMTSPYGAFSNNVTISNNSFSNFNYTGLYVGGINNCLIKENNFYGTDYNTGIYAYNCSKIIDNRINGFSGRDYYGNYLMDAYCGGIVVYHDNSSSESVSITGNTVAGNEGNGIYLYGVQSAEIKNNIFNVTSYDNERAALLIVNDKYEGGGETLMAASAPIVVEKNTILAYGAYGIFNSGCTANIYYNKLTVEGMYYTGLYCTDDNGTVADNMVACKGVVAGQFTNSNTNVYYNSFYTMGGYNALTAVWFDGYQGTFMRNICYNAGTNLALRSVNDGGYTSDENEYYSAGPTLAMYNYSGCTTLADLQNLSGKDMNSANEQLFFMTETDLKLVQLNENIYRTDPLGIGAEIEDKDFVGNLRNELQYFGCHTILPGINIIEQPKEIVNCFGTTDQMFIVVSTIDYGGTLTYQWQKDGVDIIGATNAILTLPALDFNMDGVYRCIINGNGGAHQIITNDVLLYTLRVTEITREPEDNMVDLGETAKFDLDVHVYESVPQGYKPKVQWYRDTVELKDNDRISGAKSSILTIRDITPTDYYDNYRVVISGLCGADTSRAITIMAKPKINVMTQPDTLVEICEGLAAQMEVNAEVNMTNVGISYRWKLNGVEIDDDGHFMGVRTNKLLIDKVRPSDAGTYQCVISLDKNIDVVVTNPTVLNVKLLPTITTHPPATITLKKDQELRIEFDAQGQAPLYYAWFKDGAPVGDSNAVLVKAQAALTDDGSYICKVWNECGEVWTKECEVIVTSPIMMDVTDGFTELTLLQNQPNPFSTLTQVGVWAPVAASAQISVTDIYGRQVSSFDYKLSEGYNSIGFNGSNLSDGVYYFNLTVDGIKSTIKMIVVK